MIATISMIDRFRQVYADAVESTMSDQTAYHTRSLHWHGERVSLAEAAEAFALIESYNEFDSKTLARLQTEFPDAGIEVTPAREGSVVVYLYIPDEFKDRVKEFILEHLLADEVDTVTKFTCPQDNDPEFVGEALRVWWD